MVWGGDRFLTSLLIEVNKADSGIVKTLLHTVLIGMKANPFCITAEALSSPSNVHLNISPNSADLELQTALPSQSTIQVTAVSLGYSHTCVILLILSLFLDYCVLECPEAVLL